MMCDMQFLNENKRRFSDLTDGEKGLLLLAWHKGLQIQYWVADDNEWNDESHIEDCTFNPFLDGEQYAYRIKPEPVNQVHWCNNYEHGFNGWWYKSRELANANANENRIAVIRREIVDGVVSYYKEDV